MFLASIILFLTVLFSGSLVHFFPQQNQKWLKLILAFSGAYLFTLTIIHVLPDVLVEAPNPHAVGYYILAGFFLQLILEMFSHGIEHGHMHHHEQQTDTIPYLLLFSLMVHSFLEGSILVQGGEQPGHHHHVSSGNFYRILAGIAIHHIPAAFALMSILVSRLRNFRKAFFYLSFFAIASPLGLWFSNYVLHDQVQTGTVYTVLTGLVAGNFLHISTTILFETSPEHQFNRRKLLATLAGVLLSLLSDWL
ncbi:ZIP family metal transporter [Adhaeribacter radiodurans]|uniref:ZIP family metal transporter n=1 Tax=Adhaeribacter radiodurans TaxID=2745197 RepID=A0A7L7LDR7_9BACT|nr:ZIP family metal transporter [Adhaeribacter radiodurans]QMU30986.1 ZIP family metal transporter [Adhaeribacter radiodurans]